MAFVTLTRPDDTPVSINTAYVIRLVNVPTAGPSIGPLTEGTRTHFHNNTHQDVKELLPDVEARLNAAG